MRPSLRNIIIVVLLVAIVLTFHIVRRHSTMRGLEVNVDAPKSAVLLDAADVDSLIIAAFPALRRTDTRYGER